MNSSISGSEEKSTERKTNFFHKRQSKSVFKESSFQSNRVVHQNKEENQTNHMLINNNLKSKDLPTVS